MLSGLGTPGSDEGDSDLEAGQTLRPLLDTSTKAHQSSENGRKRSVRTPVPTSVYSTATNVKEDEIIRQPFASSPPQSMRGSSLNGPIQPKNTLNNRPVYASKQNIPNVKKRRLGDQMKEFDAAVREGSNKSPRLEDNNVQITGYGSGHRRLSDGRDDLTISPHFTQTRKPLTEENPKRRVGKMLSLDSKHKAWDIISYQKGTENFDQETSNSMHLKLAEKVLEVYVDYKLRGRFTDVEIRSVMCCEEDGRYLLQLRKGTASNDRHATFVLKCPKEAKGFSGEFRKVTEVRSVPSEKITKQSCQIFRKPKCQILVNDRTEGNKSEEHIDVEEIDRVSKNAQLRKDRELAEQMQGHRPVTRGSAKVSPVSQPLAMSERSTRQRKARQDSADNKPNTISLDDRELRNPNTSERTTFKIPPKWNQSLLYPFDGPKRANVEHEDLSRLKSQEFLNDNIVNFYLRYIEENLKEKNPELYRETHFFNTFFYERLSRKDTKGNMQGVLKWTSKIDLFSKNYIIVPINESSHWYLAIICNLQHLERTFRKASGDLTSAEGQSNNDKSDSAGPASKHLAKREPGDESSKVDKPPERNVDLTNDLKHMSTDGDDEWPESDENEKPNARLEQKNRKRMRNKKEGSSSESEITLKPKGKAPRKSSHYQTPTSPAIVILDSMGTPRSSAVSKLKEWLIMEAKTKRSLEIPKDALKGTTAASPGQDNFYDCGLYMLHYVEVFLENAEGFVTSFLARDRIDSAKWRDQDIKGMRTRLFNLICGLQKTYCEKTGKKSNAPPELTLKIPKEQVSESAIISPAPSSPARQILKESTEVPNPKDKMDYQLTGPPVERPCPVQPVTPEENGRSGLTSLQVPRTPDPPEISQPPNLVVRASALSEPETMQLVEPDLDSPQNVIKGRKKIPVVSDDDDSPLSSIDGMDYVPESQEL